MIFMAIFWMLILFMLLFASLLLFRAMGQAFRFKFKFFIMGVMVFFVCGLYGCLGEGLKLHDFYSEKREKERLVQKKMRPLFSQLKKQQARLRLQLMNNPEDKMAKAGLLELLGVEALYSEEPEVAVKLWDASLHLLKDTENTESIRERILGLKNHVDYKNGKSK